MRVRIESKGIVIAASRTSIGEIGRDTAIAAGEVPARYINPAVSTDRGCTVPNLLGLEARQSRS